MSKLDILNIVIELQLLVRERGARRQIRNRVEDWMGGKERGPYGILEPGSRY